MQLLLFDVIFAQISVPVNIVNSWDFLQIPSDSLKKILPFFVKYGSL